MTAPAKGLHESMLEVDQAAAEGCRAGLEGKTLPPSKYASDDLLLAAWRVGNKRGQEARTRRLARSV